MRLPFVLLVAVALCAAAPGLAAQQRPVNIAPTAPQNRVLGARNCQFDQVQRAILPYVAMARATYPRAKRRFLAGLPAGQTMFVTTVLTDAAGHREQVFVAVDTIVGPLIVGRIWSEIRAVSGYKTGQRYQLTEDALLDWMFSKPDGSEEGNVVGKFLDRYTPPADCPAAA